MVGLQSAVFFSSVSIVGCVSTLKLILGVSGPEAQLNLGLCSQLSLGPGPN